MTRFCSFASGSSGNAALLSCGSVHVLIDMGISCRRICQCLRRLDLVPEDLSAVLITHEHADHIAGLATYVKNYATPIFCTPGTALQLEYRVAGIGRRLRPSALGQCFTVGSLAVTPLPTSHDCAESCCFSVNGPDGRFGFCTDTGSIPGSTRALLQGAQLLVLESNYDETMLRCGPYPYPLKQRIAGDGGHLSNDAAAVFAADCARAGARTILLAHLSQENNTPGRALETVGAALAAAGWAGALEALPRFDMSRGYTVEGAPCRE